MSRSPYTRFLLALVAVCMMPGVVAASCGYSQPYYQTYYQSTYYQQGVYYAQSSYYSQPTYYGQASYYQQAAYAPPSVIGSFSFQYESNGYCVRVTVTKSGSHPRTIIQSNGYNVACNQITESGRALQRTVVLQY